MHISNIKLTISAILLIAATIGTSQIEVEHNSTASDPQIRLTELSQNNFTRLEWANENSDEEWLISTRAFSGGNPLNKMDFNHYDGMSTTTFMSLNALPNSSDIEHIELTRNVVMSQPITIGKAIPANIFGQIDVFTDDLQYGIRSENDRTSNSDSFGAFLWAHGDGTGNRIGVLGQANSSTGEAWGVYGVANSTDSNEIGVFGSAAGPSGSSWAIYGAGDIYYTGSFTAPSDERLKKNIKKLQPNVLDKLMSLEVKTYEYDLNKYPSMNFAKGAQIGFLAQDLQVLFPEVVTEQTHTIFEEAGNPSSKTNQIEILGVDYIKMIPVLTSAIQEQNVIIEKMKSENESLKAEIEEIKSILAELK